MGCANCVDSQMSRLQEDWLMSRLLNLKVWRGVCHVGTGADSYERESDIAGGCFNSPKLEIGFSDEWKATDQKCSSTLRLRRGCSEARRARRSVGGRLNHPEAIIWKYGWWWRAGTFRIGKKWGARRRRAGRGFDELRLWPSAKRRR